MQRTFASKPSARREPPLYNPTMLKHSIPAQTADFAILMPHICALALEPNCCNDQRLICIETHTSALPVAAYVNRSPVVELSCKWLDRLAPLINACLENRPRACIRSTSLAAHTGVTADIPHATFPNHTSMQSEAADAVEVPRAGLQGAYPAPSPGPRLTQQASACRVCAKGLCRGTQAAAFAAGAAASKECRSVSGQRTGAASVSH